MDKPPIPEDDWATQPPETVSPEEIAALFSSPMKSKRATGRQRKASGEPASSKAKPKSKERLQIDDNGALAARPSQNPALKEAISTVPQIAKPELAAHRPIYPPAQAKKYVWEIPKDSRLRADALIPRTAVDGEPQAKANPEDESLENPFLWSQPDMNRVSPYFGDKVYHIGAAPGDMELSGWRRGEGPTREAWCGFCGSWHLLGDKYARHMTLVHGIVHDQGFTLPRPTGHRCHPSLSGWQVFCPSCGDWINISHVEDAHIVYFKHALKCRKESKAVAGANDTTGSKTEAEGKT